MEIEDEETNYRPICPDEQKDYFHNHSMELIASCISWNTVERNSKGPSRIKSELRQFAKNVRGLSPRAKTALNFNSETIPVDNLVEDLLLHIDEVIYSIPSGRAKQDPVRGRLGYDAAEIWYAHSGSIQADEFLTYLETLIEDVNTKVVPPVKIDASSLARDIRKLILG